MYQIGLFSKMNHITTKTLRHYDEIGLLKPAHIDDFTGYRYYTSAQLPRLNKIITLKQMGIGLKEIKQIIDDNSGVDTFFKLKEEELKRSIRDQQEKLLHIQNYMHVMKGDNLMTYSPVIKSLPEVIVASMRFISPSYNYYFDIIPKMGKEMNRVGAVCAQPAYCFNIYHDGEYRESDIDVEVCEAVVEAKEDTEMITFKTISKVESAICVLHKGPYTTISNAYQFVMKWVEDNGYSIIGLPRESYIDGIWNKETEDEWLTEIQFPITRK